MIREAVYQSVAQLLNPASESSKQMHKDLRRLSDGTSTEVCDWNSRPCHVFLGASRIGDYLAEEILQKFRTQSLRRA